MTEVAAVEESIINDILLIVKAVKEHLNEPNCTHKIRSIVKQALENKGAGVAGQTPQTDTDDRAGDQPTQTCPI